MISLSIAHKDLIILIDIDQLVDAVFFLSETGHYSHDAQLDWLSMSWTFLLLILSRGADEQTYRWTGYPFCIYCYIIKN